MLALLTLLDISVKAKLMDSVDDLTDLAKVLQSFSQTPGITVSL